MDIKNIENLAHLMKENDLTSLEIREGETVIKLEKRQESAVEASLPSPKAASPFTPAAAAGTESPSPRREEGTLVTSPTVGVFYSSPSPESKPFVEVGRQVKKGDVLCIIEAMKLMNEIPAEMDGVIAEICAVNGQVVEYDQPLFRIV